MAIGFVGFIVIGSEWFAMWQSAAWNGKSTAMGIVTLWTGFAVLLAMNEPSSAANERDSRDKISSD